MATRLRVADLGALAMGRPIWGGVWLLMPCLALAQGGGLDRNTVVIDAAHGGVDLGARIADQLFEKDVTLAIAERLRALFVARGLLVVMIRDGDVDGGTPDQRAEAANRAHAGACLVLHASKSTKGILVGTSALRSSVMRVTSQSREDVPVAVPWSRAQETYIAQSGQLANQIGTGLVRAGIVTTMMHVMMRPLDNLTCPAVSIEVGVPTGPETDPTPVTDSEYQQRIAESIVASLQAWRNHGDSSDSGHGAGL